MKILIVGPGAIGCLLAGYLTKSGQDVWLLDKPNQKRTKLIEAEGIKIEGVNGSHKIKVNITSDIKDIKKTEQL